MDKETWYEQIAAKLLKSDIYLALVTNNFLKSSKCATEIGLAILLDKPISLAVQEGTYIPEKLKRIADYIEYYKGPDDIGLTAHKLVKKYDERNSNAS